MNKPQSSSGQALIEGLICLCLFTLLTLLCFQEGWVRWKHLSLCHENSSHGS